MSLRSQSEPLLHTDSFFQRSAAAIGACASAASAYTGWLEIEEARKA
jgi:hypothetical protein